MPYAMLLVQVMGDHNQFVRRGCAMLVTWVRTQSSGLRKMSECDHHHKAEQERAPLVMR